MLNLVMILGCALVGVDKTEDLKGCWKLRPRGPRNTTERLAFAT